LADSKSSPLKQLDTWGVGGNEWLKAQLSFIFINSSTFVVKETISLI
jgi:hypothetical protein